MIKTDKGKAKGRSCPMASTKPFAAKELYCSGPTPNTDVNVKREKSDGGRGFIVATCLLPPIFAKTKTSDEIILWSPTINSHKY